MGSKATIANFKFWPTFKFNFFPSLLVTYPDGFTWCKKRERKMLMLGDL
jgi:hypothetical protein